MSNEEEPDYAEPQRQVQRWMGRCLISLQQSERMLKALLVDSQISARMPVATGEQPHVTRAYEQEKVTSKTLGGLVSLFCSDVVSVARTPVSDEKVLEESVRQMTFDVRFSMTLDKFEHEKLVASMREMVQMRNDLVHHLIERFDFFSLGGCLEALAYLQQCYARAEIFRETLKSVGEGMLASGQYFREMLGSEAFQKFLTTGKVPLQGSSMMDAMQIAFAACGGLDSGSVPLNALTDWLERHRPEESYEAYGRVSWAQLIHESKSYCIQRTDGAGNKITAQVVRVAS